MRRATLLAALVLCGASGCWHGTPTAPADAGGPAEVGRDERDDGDVRPPEPDLPDGDSGTDTGTDVGADVEAGDATDGRETSPPTEGGADGIEVGGPPCDVPGTQGEQQIFAEGFEAYAVGAFEDTPGSLWVRASMGRKADVSSAAAASGAKSLVIQSFTTKSETEYAPLALGALPTRISFQLTALLDGFIIYEDFIAFGLGIVRSKYDLEPVLQLKMSNHTLSLVQGGVQTPLFLDLAYGDPARANTVRVDLDLCSWQAQVSVGVPAPLVARATVSVAPFASVSALFVTGGVNDTYVDDIAVSIVP